MRDDLDKTVDKLRNPLMKTGLMVLHSLLDSLDGPRMKPADVRKEVEKIIPGVSKQSITNSARRLEDASVIERDEGLYKVRYGYLISVLLNEIIELHKKVDELDEALEELKQASGT